MAHSDTQAATVIAVIDLWKREGTNMHPSLDGMPLHPEFVYRRTGEWKGWSDFLGCEPSDENAAQDAIENKAWALLSGDGDTAH